MIGPEPAYRIDASEVTLVNTPPGIPFTNMD